MDNGHDRASIRWAGGCLVHRPGPADRNASDTAWTFESYRRAVSLIKPYLTILREDSAPDIVPSNVKKLTAIQTTLNCVQIAFGTSMLGMVHQLH